MDNKMVSTSRLVVMGSLKWEPDPNDPSRNVQVPQYLSISQSSPFGGKRVRVDLVDSIDHATRFPENIMAHLANGAQSELKRSPLMQHYFGDESGVEQALRMQPITIEVRTEVSVINNPLQAADDQDEPDVEPEFTPMRPE